METQTRAFLDHAVAEQLICEAVTRDYDGMFTAAFDQVFKERSIRVKPVGPQAPNLNAFVERWIQSSQQESLDRFSCFGQEHFDYIVSEYVPYYLSLRPHQGIGNVFLPQSGGQPAEVTTPDEKSDFAPLTLADIQCETRLGGLLRQFCRAAA